MGGHSRVKLTSEKIKSQESRTKNQESRILVKKPKLKMKQILILAVLVAVANAYSIEALKEMMNELERRDTVTLREYLDSLETPDPTYKVSSKRSFDEREEIDCKNVCGPVPTLNLGQSCLSNRWKPNYAKKGESCECLTEYRCCTDDCPTVTTDTCLGEDKSEKGRMYGVIPED